MHNALRWFLLWVLFPFVIVAADPPPPLVRSVLSTNLPPFGLTGQALFRTANLPYLDWSNIVQQVIDTNAFQPASANLTNWSLISTNALTGKLDSNVWWVAWGSLDTNALTGKLDSNYWFTVWGAIATNALTAKLDSNWWWTAYGGKVLTNSGAFIASDHGNGTNTTFYTSNAFGVTLAEDIPARKLYATNGQTVMMDFSDTLNYTNNTHHYPNLFLANSGNTTMSGYGNMLFGEWAGVSLTSGHENLIMGWLAGAQLTTGHNNIFLGHGAGYGAGSGSNNVVIGNQPGHNILDGYDNIYIGEATGGATAGTLNTLVGANSFSANAGNGNTSLGAYSGYYTTGDHNTFIGYSCGFNQVASSYNLFIDNYNRGSAANDLAYSLVYGHFDTTIANQFLRIVPRLGINTNSPQSPLHIVGDNTVPNVLQAGTTNYPVLMTLGTNGDVHHYPQVTLATNAFEVVGTNGITGKSVVITSDGKVGIGTNLPQATEHIFASATNQFVQRLEATNNTGLWATDTNGNIWKGADRWLYQDVANNLGLGRGSFTYSGFTTASGNVAVGDGSMTYTTSAIHNTGVGYQTLYNTDAGSRNTAIGYKALTLASGASTSDNVAIGDQSLSFLNTSGYQQVAIGSSCLFSNTTGYGNVSVGYYSMRGNRSGFNNVAIGRDTLEVPTNAANNVAVGNFALQNLLDAPAGSAHNTAVGYKSMWQTTNSTYSTVVGFEAMQFASNTIGSVAVGAFAGVGNTTSGYSNQWSVLDNYVTFIGYDSTRDTNTPISTTVSNATAIGWRAKVAADNCTVLGNELTKVGIGTNSPAARLHVTADNSAPNVLQVDTTNRHDLLVVNTNGHVGIGTNNPQAVLHVTGTNGPSQYIVQVENPMVASKTNLFTIGTNNEVHINTSANLSAAGLNLGDQNVIGGSGGTLYLGSGNSSETFIIQPGNGGYLGFSSGGTERGRWSVDKLGIGTNAPQSRLHLIANNAVDNVLIAGTTNRPTLLTLSTNGVLSVNPGGGLNPVGCYGALMMNATNIVVCAGAAGVYTNIAGTGYTTIVTNGFYGDTNGNSSALTNLYAGYYRVQASVSYVGANAGAYEAEIFTNNVSCDLIGWKDTFDTPARLRNGGAAGIIYLPAGCRTSVRIQDGGAGTSIAIQRTSLVIGTP